MSRSNHQSGFTIIEFMIASTVFSVIILVVTAGILTMNKSYQKSLYASRTQAATSNLVDTIGQAVKFSSSDIMNVGDASNGTTAMVCVGNREFLYVIGRQMDNTASTTKSKNVIMSRANTDNCAGLESIVTTTPSGTPKELLGRGMRLDRLEIKPAASLVTISARVVYGDDDLLCSDGVSGSCDTDDKLQDDKFYSNDKTLDLRCKPRSGSEYCAVSELSTTVYRRL